MPGYREPARSYVSSLLLLLVLAIGFGIDTGVGGGRVHALAWAIAAVLVVGIDALTVYAARSLRSITVTADEIRVGEDSLPREEIVAVEPEPPADLPVLGRRYGEGLPRGTVGVGVRLADGRGVVLATRHPDRLLAALGSRTVPTAIRRATPADLAHIPDIDERAEALFHVAGYDLPRIPYDVDALRDAAAVFVAGEPPVGYVQVDEVDGEAHIAEISVLPASMGQGIGSRLLEQACAWARDAGYPGITLTTYADVPWNAPFYAARGFAEVDKSTPGLVAVRQREIAAGLDAVGRRVVMRRELADAAPPRPADTA